MSWKKYEKRHAKKHRGKHIGGPGKPDYTRGKKKGEVKARKRPLTKPEVQRVAKKGVKEIISKSGFTGPAKKYAKRHRPDLKLIHPRSKKKSKS